MSDKPRPFWKLETITPPLNVPVFVLWGGRGPFIAARVRHPRTGREAWAAVFEGEDVFLPMGKAEALRRLDRQRPWKGFHTLKGDAPDAWSPQHPERWGLKMPASDFDLVDVPATYWSEGQSFNAVEAAEEMEADRERARSAPREQVEPRRPLFWLDASLVRIEDPPNITMRNAEARIMRALALQSFAAFLDGSAMHRGQADDFWQFFSIEQIREFVDCRGETPGAVPPIKEFQADRADYLTAMSWFNAIVATGDKHKARLLLLASRPHGLTFSEIAASLDLKSRQAAQQMYRKVIAEVWAIANGFAHHGAAVLKERMSSVRAGNLQYRRGTTA